MMPPYPEHFIHWVTAGTRDYLVFDYQQRYFGDTDSDSIGKLSLHTGVVEPIINASPYHWRLSLYADPSSSGSLIAYTSCEFVTNYTSNHDTEIAIIDWNTLESTRLTDTTAYDFFPVWSPDGERIVFLSWVGLGLGGYSIFASDSVVVNVADAEGELKASRRGALLYPVAWSPNSNEFAFIDAISVNEDSAPNRGPIVQIGILLTEVDETTRQIASAISYETRKYSRSTRFNSITFGGPSWSPDGSEIAFGSSDYESAIVRIINREGMNDRVIWQGESSAPISQVTWSPDGEEILFIADAARIIRPDGSGLRELELPYGDAPRQLDLPFEDASNLRAAWSPDSSQIAIYDGWDTIVTVDRDGAGVRAYRIPCRWCNYQR